MLQGFRPQHSGVPELVALGSGIAVFVQAGDCIRNGFDSLHAALPVVVIAVAARLWTEGFDSRAAESADKSGNVAFPCLRLRVVFVRFAVRAVVSANSRACGSVGVVESGDGIQAAL